MCEYGNLVCPPLPILATQNYMSAPRQFFSEVSSWASSIKVISSYDSDSLYDGSNEYHCCWKNRTSRQHHAFMNSSFVKLCQLASSVNPNLGTTGMIKRSQWNSDFLLIVSMSAHNKKWMIRPCKVIFLFLVLQV